ncbi:MAG: hypothetical protein V4501_02050 [Pseudomonadota bacterium]
MSNEPEYELDDFVNDCAMGTSKVSVSHGAMSTARTDFNLGTQVNVLEFIANGGLEKPVFINKRVWDNNPDRNIVIMVDAYAFFSGLIYGYIAFVYVAKTERWLIKSFKKHQGPDSRNLAFLGPLKKLLDKGV